MVHLWKYLRAGTSYGGPCFPRDNRLLAFAARQAGADAPLALANDQINEQAKVDLLEQVKSRVAPGGTVAVLGLAYKPDTYITEESAGLHLAQHLKRQGYRVLAHDFAAAPSNSPALHEFEMLQDVSELARGANIDLAVICCPWPQYRTLQLPAEKLLSPWAV